MNQQDRIKYCNELTDNLRNNAVTIFDFMGYRLVKVNRDGIVFLYGQYMCNHPYNQHLKDMDLFGIYNPNDEMFYYQKYYYSELEYGMRINSFIEKILNAATSRLSKIVDSELLPMQLDEFDQRRYKDWVHSIKCGRTEKDILLRIAHDDCERHLYDGRIENEYIDESEVIEAMTDFEAVIPRIVERYIEKNVLQINYHIEYENYIQSEIQRIKTNLPDNVKYMAEIYKAVCLIEAKSFYTVIGSDDNNVSCRIDKNYLMFKHDMEIPTYNMPARDRESVDLLLGNRHSYIQPQDILEIMYRGKTIYKKK